MKGFFTKSQMLAMGKKPASIAPRCELCKLYKGCVSPKMPTTGYGKLGILVVAEAPGAKEDERNKQLIGKAGQELRNALEYADVDLDLDCWKTNAIICRPPKNRKPTDDELIYCKPYLKETIEKYQPHTIIPLGDAAIKQVLNEYWDQEFGAVERWVGNQIPLRPTNTWVCPTWHPSYVMREKNVNKDKAKVLTLWFRKHLKAAAELQKRPYKTVPKYEVEQHTEISSIVDDMRDYQGMAAFDYECNTLKPDGDESVAVSMAICWGRGKIDRCIAFPLTNGNREAARRFLRSPIPKIAANLKFEERWSMLHFKTLVRNWVWDTMQCAHVLDNRQSTTNLDFQAFTRLGLPPYSSHIKPLLKAKKGLTVNQIIEEISLPHLLEYNGLDTITEFELAVQQMKQLKRTPPWRD